MRLCIDLCSGLGGFSQAFMDAGWEVITVDIEPKFKPTIRADITKLTASEIEAKTKLGSFKAYEGILVLASPPCTAFSLAAMNGWPRKGIRLGLEIVGAVMELIAEIQPTYWVLENPRAHLRKFLGIPQTTVFYSDFFHSFPKPTDLWGNVPFGLAPIHSQSFLS